MCSGAPRLARQQKVARTRVRAGMWRAAAAAASDGKVSGAAAAAAAGLSAAAAAAGGCFVQRLRSSARAMRKPA